MIESAMVLFFARTSYQSDIGNWLAMMVDFLACLSSMISIKSMSCCPLSLTSPKSSTISRSMPDSLSKNLDMLDSIRAMFMASLSFCIL